MKQQFFVGDVVKLNQLGLEAGNRAIQDANHDLWNSKYLLMLKQQGTAVVSKPSTILDNQVWLEDNAFFVTPEHLKVVERAWQKNAGKQPVDDDVYVEVGDIYGNRRTITASEVDWYIFGTDSDVSSWRIADSVSSDEEQPEAIPPSHVALGSELVQVGGQYMKIWCDTCQGTGEIDETLGGESFSGRDTPCPDCAGNGWWERKGDVDQFGFGAATDEILAGNTQQDKKHSHYFKKCGYDYVDVYRILKMFDVTDPCISHACKKLLVTGGRGFKDIDHDIQDVIDTLVRWQEMRKEDDELCK